MNGITNQNQLDHEYCWQLIQEYSILDTAQIYTLLHRAGNITNKKARHRIVRRLHELIHIHKISHDGRNYIAKAKNLTPTGRFREQILCFWVLLDYIGKIDNHYATGTYSRISMEAGDRSYSIVYVERGHEPLCNANMKRGGDTKYIVLIEDVAQIPMLDSEKVHAFAAVTLQGKTEYYSKG